MRLGYLVRPHPLDPKTGDTRERNTHDTGVPVSADEGRLGYRYDGHAPPRVWATSLPDCTSLAHGSVSVPTTVNDPDPYDLRPREK